MVKKLFLALFLANISYSAKGDETSTKPLHSQPLRVGGDFKVSKIEKLGPNDFRVFFDSLAKSEKGNRLVLNTSHIHFGISEGATLRLSAEIISEDNSSFEVTQMLIFLPKENYGFAPVWFLSNRHPAMDFRGAKWLEMHAPQADFDLM